MSKAILCITEGKDPEIKILNRLKKEFIEEDIEFILFKNNIYQIYNKLKKYAEEIDSDYEEIDILLFLKKFYKQENIKDKKRKDFISIYLFMDLDKHEPLSDNDSYTNCLLDMLKLFDNETENGKLYISYPMADAFLHLVESGDTVDISLGRDYKKEVTKHKRQKNIKGIKFIEKAGLDSLLIAHVKATQYLLHDDFSYPTSYENNVKDKFTQEIIYQKQLDKFINQEKKILILSPFALFLLEYRGKSLFDSWLSIN